MQLIASNFHNNEPPWTLKRLVKETNISEPALNLIMSSLTANNLLTMTGGKKQQYLPTQSLENITVDMVLTAARNAEECTNLRPDDVTAVEKVDEVILDIDKAISEATRGKSLKDLV
jgi:DNA-binding IscR family transcriptional regulator